MNIISNSWDIQLQSIYQTDWFCNLMNQVNTLYQEKIVYPKRCDLFNAFLLTPYESVKVVILGQDPYHGEGEAHGLSFSVQEGIKLPPSLKNIYKELNSDLGIPISDKGDLTCWAKQGVLLLNSTLTVLKDQPNSLSRLGWSQFTDEVISILNDREDPVVFILWGNFAREKKNLITNPKHLIIESAHPSPFSARNGFFGSRPFSKTNEFLKENGETPIDWEVK